ncbi:MAG: hypothetical protein RL082_1143 [Pseudomonadota bacterium]
MGKIMLMKSPKDYLFLIPYLLAVCLGLKFGYDFGMQISGPIMGKKRRGDSK